MVIADEVTRGNLKPDSRSVLISELKVARSIFCRPSNCDLSADATPIPLMSNRFLISVRVGLRVFTMQRLGGTGFQQFVSGILPETVRRSLPCKFSVSSPPSGWRNPAGSRIEPARGRFHHLENSSKVLFRKRVVTFCRFLPKKRENMPAFYQMVTTIRGIGATIQ